MKTKCLLYCTMAKPYLFRKRTRDLAFWQEKDIDEKDTLNGKIVAECEMECEKIFGSNMITFEKASCVDRVSMFKYLNPLVVWDNSLENLLQASEGRKMGYALHISNLKVFDEPRKLNEFYCSCENCGICGKYVPKRQCDRCHLTKAPQNMCYCEYKGEKYCLISIRPEWVCKILNGEKTIEIRRKVLKEMLKNETN